MMAKATTTVRIDSGAWVKKWEVQHLHHSEMAFFFGAECVYTVHFYFVFIITVILVSIIIVVSTIVTVAIIMLNIMIIINRYFHCVVRRIGKGRGREGKDEEVKG